MPGKVYLVGAGPGDPGLVTARALELLATADVVLYDRLVPRRLLDRLHGGPELVYVGKEPGLAAMPQEDVNACMVELAQEGRTVVRLKGGDPFVFGRGGEEAESLAEAGVPFEVVPGVTAGVAAAAYAGIPVTHRDEASAVAFVTGHEDPAKEESAIDWDALAAFPGTLVFYMGVRNLERIASALVEAGRPADEPAAVVASGTTPRQRTVTGTLADIARRASEEGVRPPALTVVGPVAGLRERLAWYERRPLLGRTVVVTRARAQASELAARLEVLGAEVVEAPAIRIEPLGSPEVYRAVEGIGDYSLVCLTSANAARLLMEGLARAGLDARALAGATVAAVGSGTADELARAGIQADVVPERSVAEGLVAALADVPVEGRRVLVARAEEARETLPDALRERGAELDVVALYRTVAEDPSEDVLEAASRADYVTFTSSSTVRWFAEAIGDRFPSGARIASIGPVTSEALRERGREVHVEAERHDVDGLVEALCEDAAG
ncbi:MAG TPA: uroporphyrinogen-III C-methyltransferase [Thermoleophilaceae bacterium]|jgi:uroporphyrinogen III methyltransferase/synthase